LFEHLRKPDTIFYLRLVLQRFQSIYLQADPSAAEILKQIHTNYPKRLHAKTIMGIFIIRYFPNESLPDFTSDEARQVLTTSSALFQSFWRLVGHYKNRDYLAKDDLCVFPRHLMDYVKAFTGWSSVTIYRITQHIFEELKMRYEQYELMKENIYLPELCEDLKSNIMHLHRRLIDMNYEKQLTWFHRSYPCPFADRPAPKPEYDHGKSICTNIAMTHELLVDPGFRLTDVWQLPYSDLDQRCPAMRRQNRRTYYNMLAAELANRNSHCHATLRILVDIKEKIEGLDGPECKEVAAIIDVPRIRQQMADCTFSYTDVVNMLFKLCQLFRSIQQPAHSTVFEEEWAALFRLLQVAQTFEERGKAFAMGLRFCKDAIDRIMVDTVNARLAKLAGVVQLHGVNFERSRMRELLETGNVCMASTEDFVRRNLRGLTDHTRSQLANTHFAFRGFLERCITRMVSPLEEPRPLPVIMRLDAYRLNYARVAMATTARGCVLLASIRLAYGDEGNLLAAKTADLFLARSSVTPDAFKKEVLDNFSQFASFRYEELFQPDHEIYKNMAMHITRIVQVYCGSAERGRRPPTLKTQQLPPLLSLHDKLAKACKAVHEACWVALAVHGEIYRHIVRRIDAEESEATSRAAQTLMELARR